jgi:phosphate transport system substrate-binding protein
MDRRTFLVAALVIAGCTRGGGEQTSQTTTTSSSGVSLKGSDTMVILGQRWAEHFMKENPGITVQVTGWGSGTGIAALINGTTDICQSSRPMTQKEKADVKAKRGKDAVEKKVALDAVAVYVNAKSPVTEIAIPALARIYRGDATNWKQVGGPDQRIVTYGRENNSGTYAYFKEHVLDNDDFAAHVQTLAGTSAVASAVKGDALGIGYGGIAYSEGVRLLKIKKDAESPAVAPSLGTAEDGSYPLSRYLFFYTAGEPTGNAKKLSDWVTTPAGQKVIAEVGYYPLPKE